MFGASAWGQQNNQQQQQQQPQQQGGGLFGTAAPATNAFGGGGGGFGQAPTSTFGQPAQQPQQTSLFGGGAPASTPSFGFGSQNNTAARPAFGASTTTFGAPAASSGSLFGSASTTSNAFGSTAPSTFGQPAAPASGGLFGSSGGGGFGSNTGSTGAFGSTAGSSLFGAPQTGGFGAQAAPQAAKGVPATGTADPIWSATKGPQEQIYKKDSSGIDRLEPAHNDMYQTITAMPQYMDSSLNELRLKDYEQNRKAPQPGQTGFGQPAQTSTFGSTPAASGGLFGSSAGTSTFGQAPKPAGGLFGAPASSTPAFGAPAAPASGGLFGSSGVGAFGSSSGGAFGAQPAKPAFGGFGAPAAQPTSTFGAPQQQQQQTSTFGGFGQQQPAQPAAPTSTFGGFGQQPQQQQQPTAPSTGLFGSTSNNTGSSLFGAPKPAGTGLFGAPAAPAAPAGGLFSSQPAASSGGLFGSNPTPPASGGLFGQTNSTPSSGGLFGQPQQNQQQGQQQNQGSSLFGGGGGGLFGAKPATPAPSGGLFGSAPAPAPQTGGGLFGGGNTGGGGLFGSTNQQPQQQQNNGSSLFGQPPKPAGGGLFGGGGGGLFGSQSQPQQQQQQPQQQNLQASIDQNPYGRNPLFDQPGPALPLMQELSNKKLPLLPLSSRSRAGSQSGRPLTRLRGFAASPASSNGRASPGLSNSAGRASPARGNSLAGLSDDTSVALSPHAFVSRNSVKKLVLDRRVDSSDLLASRTSSMGSPAQGGRGGGFADSFEKPKVTFDARINVDSFFNNDFNSPAARKTGFSASNGNGQSDTPSRPPPAKLINGNDNSYGQASSNGSSAAPSSKAPLQHGEYYTKPDLDVLVRSGYQDLTALSNFVVGRKGYGEVAFLEPVDLTSVPSIRDIPGTIVLFADKVCEVYPDTVSKAPRGTGLNVPAQITLERCWPMDKATREPIKDTAAPKMKSHLRLLKGMPETEFVDYSAESGTWVFKVQHFSKYGLVSSEDEDEEDEEDVDASMELRRPPQGSTTPRQPPPSRRSAQMDEDEAEFDDDDLPPVTYGSDDETMTSGASSSSSTTQNTKTRNISSQDTPRRYASHSKERSPSDDDLTETERSDEDIETSEVDEPEELSEGDEQSEDRSQISQQDSLHLSELDRGRYEDDDEEAGSRSGGNRGGSQVRAWGSVLGVEPRKVQVMQASFFRSGEQQRQVDGTPKAGTKSNAAERFASRKHVAFLDEEDGVKLVESSSQRPSFETSAAPLSRPTKKYTRIETKDSLVKGREGVFADAGLMMGRSFRVGWGPDGTLVHMGKLCGLQESSSPASGSTLKLEQIRLLSKDPTNEEERSRRLFDIQIANTSIQFDEDTSIPSATPFPSLRFHHFAPSFAADDHSFEAQLWRLGSALFDEIDLGLPSTSSPKLIDRVAGLRRKLALSKWLQAVVTPSVDHDLLDAQDAGPARVFALLTGNQIERAAQTAIDAGDLRLATLITRIGGNQAFKDDVRIQLEKWREHRVDPLISADYRKIYSLLAGIVDVSEGNRARDPSESTEEVIIPAGLDWKRAFGLHFWFAAPFEAGLAEGLRRYEDALQTQHAPASPLPWYLERPSLAKDSTRWQTPRGTQDALFLLLNLQADTATPLESALNPSTFGPTPLDYRLPWHLYTVLALAMRTRDFADRQLAEDGEELGSSASANALTANYAWGLEQMGLWDQAAFVLLHLDVPEARQKALKDLLARQVGKDEEKEKFVVEKLLVPAEWIAEAKANVANDRGDPYSRYYHLLDAKLYDHASSVVVRELLVEALIVEDFTLVKGMLEPLKNVKLTESHVSTVFSLVETLEHLPSLLESATRGTKLNPEQADEFSLLSSNLPSLIRSLPEVFSDSSLQTNVVLSDVLTKLLRLGSLLAVGSHLPVAPTSSHQMEELSLVQAGALDSFLISLEQYN